MVSSVTMYINQRVYNDVYRSSHIPITYTAQQEQLVWQ